MRPETASLLLAIALQPALPVVAENWVVLDSRRVPVGKTVDAVQVRDGKPSVVTTVHLDGGRSFPVQTNSPAYVSADRSRVLVAGGQLDPMTSLKGGEALLYDREGQLLRKLMTFDQAWLEPGPAFAIEPSGAVWIASNGTLSSFDRDGAPKWSHRIPRFVEDIVLSPRLRWVALTLNTLLAPGPPVLLLNVPNRVFEEVAPAELVHAIEFVDEDSLIAVSDHDWMLLQRGENGRLTTVRSGRLGGDLLGPRSVTASDRGWFVVALSAGNGVSIQVIETASGRTLLEKRYPGSGHDQNWRHVSVEGDKLRVTLGGKEHTFTVR